MKAIFFLVMVYQIGFRDQKNTSVMPSFKRFLTGKGYQAACYTVQFLTRSHVVYGDLQQVNLNGVCFLVAGYRIYY